MRKMIPEAHDDYYRKLADREEEIMREMDLTPEVRKARIDKLMAERDKAIRDWSWADDSGQDASQAWARRKAAEEDILTLDPTALDRSSVVDEVADKFFPKLKTGQLDLGLPKPEEKLVSGNLGQLIRDLPPLKDEKAS